MKNAAHAAELVGYYMQVDLLVEEAKSSDFEARFQSFIGETTRPFARLDPRAEYELVLALKTPRAAAFGADDGGRAGDKLLGTPLVRYVHLWRVPSLASLDLANIMIRCADDSQYMAVNALVTRERQEFLRLVQRPAPLPAPSASPTVRICRRLPSKHLGAYLFRSGALLPAMVRAGWKHLGQFQNVTGDLNTVTEFWQSERGADSEAMYAMLAQTDELGRRLVDDVTRRLPDSEQRVVLETPAYFASLRAKVA